jgi:hypothetical protein
MTHADNPGCLTTILGWFGLNNKGNTHKELPGDKLGTLPFHVRDDFLSPAEASFFQILRTIAGENYLVFPKVSLKDLFFVARPDQNRHYYNQINQKHVDFVLCDPSTLKPVMAVELDDSSHQRPDRVERDEFVNRVFQDAGLPLLHYPAKSSYNTQEINASIQRMLNTSNLDVQPKPIESRQDVTGEQTKICPKCGSPMVLRTATRGPQAGKKFYGCSSYPNCRFVLSVEKC